MKRRLVFSVIAVLVVALAVTFFVSNNKEDEKKKVDTLKDAIEKAQSKDFDPNTYEGASTLDKIRRWSLKDDEKAKKIIESVRKKVDPKKIDVNSINGSTIVDILGSNGLITGDQIQLLAKKSDPNSKGGNLSIWSLLNLSDLDDFSKAKELSISMETADIVITKIDLTKEAGLTSAFSFANNKLISETSKNFLISQVDLSSVNLNKNAGREMLLLATNYLGIIPTASERTELLSQINISNENANVINLGGSYGLSTSRNLNESSLEILLKQKELTNAEFNTIFNDCDPNALGCHSTISSLLKKDQLLTNSQKQTLLQKVDFSKIDSNVSLYTVYKSYVLLGGTINEEQELIIRRAIVIEDKYFTTVIAALLSDKVLTKEHAQNIKDSLEYLDERDTYAELYKPEILLLNQYILSK